MHHFKSAPTQNTQSRQKFKPNVFLEQIENKKEEFAHHSCPKAMPDGEAELYWKLRRCCGAVTKKIGTKATTSGILGSAGGQELAKAAGWGQPGTGTGSGSVSEFHGMGWEGGSQRRLERGGNKAMQQKRLSLAREERGRNGSR